MSDIKQKVLEKIKQEVLGELQFRNKLSAEEFVKKYNKRNIVNQAIELTEKLTREDERQKAQEEFENPKEKLKEIEKLGDLLLKTIVDARKEERQSIISKIKNKIEEQKIKKLKKEIGKEIERIREREKELYKDEVAWQTDRTWHNEQSFKREKVEVKKNLLKKLGDL